jgi:uncharacterized protein YqgC (DUF456 family)
MSDEWVCGTHRLSFIAHRFGMDSLAITALLIMALGLAGIVIPGIPGVLVVFGGAVFYSLLSGFREFNAGWLVFMGAIAAGATAFDLIAAPAVARRFGASKWGVIGAIIGLVVLRRRPAGRDPAPSSAPRHSS